MYIDIKFTRLGNPRDVNKRSQSLALISEDTHLVFSIYSNICNFSSKPKGRIRLWINTVTGQLSDNCIQNFHFGRYIVGYTVGNLVLRRRYTSPNESVECGYPHSNAFLQVLLNLERCVSANNMFHR